MHSPNVRSVLNLVHRSLYKLRRTENSEKYGEILVIQKRAKYAELDPAPQMPFLGWAGCCAPPFQIVALVCWYIFHVVPTASMDFFTAMIFAIEVELIIH
jgi:hypothetical protein